MWIWILAEPPPGIPDILSNTVLGAVLIAILTGILWPKPSVERLIKENEALRRIVEEALPKIEAALRTLGDLVAGLMDERGHHDR